MISQGLSTNQLRIHHMRIKHTYVQFYTVTTAVEVLRLYRSLRLIHIDVDVDEGCRRWMKRCNE